MLFSKTVFFEFASCPRSSGPVEAGLPYFSPSFSRLLAGFSWADVDNPAKTIRPASKASVPVILMLLVISILLSFDHAHSL